MLMEVMKHIHQPIFQSYFKLMVIKFREYRTKGFDTIFKELDKLKNKELTIIETGTMRKDSPDGDGNALELFEQFALDRRENKTSIFSVDIDEEAVDFAIKRKKVDSTTILQMDSVAFLKAVQFPADLYYLDSLDFDPNRPYISAIHHLKELLAIYDNGLLRNCIVAVDDNFGDKGKGVLVRKFLEEIPYAKLICDGYLLVWKIE